MFRVTRQKSQDINIIS